MKKLDLNIYEILKKCPLCKSESIEELYSSKDYFNNIDGIFFLSRCDSCKLYFQNPRIKNEHINLFYPPQTTYYVPNESWKVADPIKYIKDMGIINIGKQKRVLDLGCSYGKNLLILKKLGWNVLGVEMNNDAAKYGIDNGINIECCLIENFSTQNKFDLVILSMVLEHVYDFRGLLKNISEMLDNNGYLSITIPTYSGSLYLFGRFAYALQLPSHLYFFNKKNINVLLEENNLKFISVKYQQNRDDFIKSLYIASKYGNGLSAKMCTIVYSRKKLLNFLSKIYSFLGKLGFTSRMSIVAIKK